MRYSCGAMSEWLKESVLKTDMLNSIVGSNPTRSARLSCLALCGYHTTVSILAFQARDVGSIPITRSKYWVHSAIGSAGDS